MLVVPTPITRKERQYFNNMISSIRLAKQLATTPMEQIRQTMSPVCIIHQQPAEVVFPPRNLHKVGSRSSHITVIIMLHQIPTYRWLLIPAEHHPMVEIIFPWKTIYYFPSRPTQQLMMLSQRRHHMIKTKCQQKTSMWSLHKVIFKKH